MYDAFCRRKQKCCLPSVGFFFLLVHTPWNVTKIIITYPIIGCVTSRRTASLVALSPVSYDHLVWFEDPSNVPWLDMYLHIGNTLAGMRAGADPSWCIGQCQGSIDRLGKGWSWQGVTRRLDEHPVTESAHTHIHMLCHVSYQPQFRGASQISLNCFGKQIGLINLFDLFAH